MPQLSHEPERPGADLRHVALKIRNRINRLGLTESALARRCSLLPEHAAISRERVAKILMNCKRAPEKSAAKTVTRHELVAIASALDISFEWLAGQPPPHDPVCWDLLGAPARAAHLVHLFEEYDSSDALYWSEHVQAPLLTPQFMRAYHESLAESLSPLLAGLDRRRVVETYDRVGEARRGLLLAGPGAGRGPHAFTQVIFLSDLERISDGRDEYARLGRRLREECLGELADLLSGARGKVSLCVVPDGAAPARTLWLLRGYRSLAVFGASFTMSGYRSGRVAWSEHRRHVAAHRRLIREAKAGAVNRDHREAAELLRGLAARAR